MNEQSLKEKIKHIARSRGRTFNQVWRALILERFLVRLSRSSQQKKFIFKGGLFLSYCVTIDRETRDIDFSTHLNRLYKKGVSDSLNQVCRTDVGDGFMYQIVKAETMTAHWLKQQLFRLHLKVSFGNMIDRMQIDVAVQDDQHIITKNIPLTLYKGQALFEKSILLSTCSLENLFAEKLESIVSKMEFNTRMKDYHDIFLLCKKRGMLDAALIQNEITKVFNRHGTDFQTPIQFSESGMKALQKQWAKHVDALIKTPATQILPRRIENVLKEINQWLQGQKIKRI